MMTVGGCFANWMRRVSPPRIVTSSSLTICTTCWAGLRAFDTSSPRARSRTAGREIFHYFEGDVGLEQGATDLANGAVDIRRAQLALAAQVLKGLSEAVGEVSENSHGQSSLT